MKKLFEELDSQPSPIGEISLRRRWIASIGRDVYEVKLRDEYLMSSLFPEAEIALSELGLSRATGEELDVVVGGLGLGYTAVAALKNPGVRSLLVVEYLEPVIDWHRRGLVPLGGTLSNDPRCRFVHADFFKLAAVPAEGFDPAQAGRRFHAILLDIDHTPSNLLSEKNGAFYSVEGLIKLREQLLPGGVFALWSDAAPDDEFLTKMRAVFRDVDARVIPFANPLTGGTSSNSVYLGTKG